MADVKAIILDPDFQSLSVADQKSILAEVDPDFSQISDADFSEMVGGFANAGKRQKDQGLGDTVAAKEGKYSNPEGLAFLIRTMGPSVLGGGLGAVGPALSKLPWLASLAMGAVAGGAGEAGIEALAQKTEGADNPAAIMNQGALGTIFGGLGGAAPHLAESYAKREGIKALRKQLESTIPPMQNKARNLENWSSELKETMIPQLKTAATSKEEAVTAAMAQAKADKVRQAEKDFAALKKQHEVKTTDITAQKRKLDQALKGQKLAKTEKTAANRTQTIYDEAETAKEIRALERDIAETGATGATTAKQKALTAAKERLENIKSNRKFEASLLQEAKSGDSIKILNRTKTLDAALTKAEKDFIDKSAALQDKLKDIKASKPSFDPRNLTEYKQLENAEAALRQARHQHTLYKNQLEATMQELNRLPNPGGMRDLLGALRLRATLPGTGGAIALYEYLRRH